VKRIAEREE